MWIISFPLQSFALVFLLIVQSSVADTEDKQESEGRYGGKQQGDYSAGSDGESHAEKGGVYDGQHGVGKGGYRGNF